MSTLETAAALGRIRWQGATPSLMGRVLTVNARVQVYVSLPSANGQGASEGVWLDAEVVAIAKAHIELRTSFARFVAEPNLPSRWPPDASPLTRSELERVFAESVASVSAELSSLVTRFQNDPELKRAPAEQLMRYSVAVSDCADKVRAMSVLISDVSQDLSSQADRSKLLVAQPPRK